MRWNEEVVEEPYPCDPTKQEIQCQLYVEGDADVVDDGTGLPKLDPVPVAN